MFDSILQPAEGSLERGGYPAEMYTRREKVHEAVLRIVRSPEAEKALREAQQAARVNQALTSVAVAPEVEPSVEPTQLASQQTAAGSTALDETRILADIAAIHVDREAQEAATNYGDQDVKEAA